MTGPPSLHTQVLPLLLGFFAALILAFAAERVAHRLGVVARPATDRWHRKTVPLLGGVAIVAGTAVPLTVIEARPEFLVLAAASAAMAIVGLVDDVRALSPQGKLLAQIVIGALLLLFGFSFHPTGFELLDLFVTLFWIVGVTNAFNLLDNMDGLAASVAAVAAAFRLLFFYWDGDTGGMAVTAGFIGALGGFLVRNFPPAKIFMGDAGSLFVGFFLAGLSLVPSAHAYSRGTIAVLVVPVLLLLTPIFDTAFVTLTRVLRGSPVHVGGSDHTSHRLVAVGLGERKTVAFLAAVSTAAGGIAALSYGAGLSWTVVLLALLVIGLVLFGIHLSRVRAVEGAAGPNGGTVLRLLANFQYKRQVMTVLLDACLIPIAYYAAYLVRFEEEVGRYIGLFYRSVPAVLVIQLATLAIFGVYRGVWQFTSLSDLLRIGRATAIGTMGAVVALVYTTRFEGFSRTVFILDGVFLFVLVAGSRVSFRVFAEMLRPTPPSHQRVLVYGAGAGGELIVRELLNNPGLQRIPVGFVDDDRSKHQTRIHGVSVMGGSEDIEEIARRCAAQEVIISSGKIQGPGLDHVTDACQQLGIAVRRASIRLD
ncbi:MAG: hypothetical protein ACREM3_05850 [Candidatus Rokuibacteriota bacterium]